ncbi:TetR-like C-terminal domain-containing protein [Streptomyces sp. UP1A-1]|nr:TetR-like C-terminal domain-containing protein [Streptomyces sp. UP1A-1]
MRSWALADPQRYFLVFGTPVPGYHAPADVTQIAAETMAVILDACAGPHGRGRGADGVRGAPRRPPAVGGRAPGSPAALHRALSFWTRLHGVLSLELAGHFAGMGFDPALLFAAELDDLTAH